jgi:hypothetical protein
MLAKLNADLTKWRRFLEPVFSGSHNNEVNKIPAQQVAS